MTLGCPDGSIIQIDSAMFGHYEHHHCGGALVTGNCESPGAFDYLDGLCSGSQTCEAEVEWQTFGGPDPCHGTSKYLQLHYTCSMQSQY